jgi:hypothetical protein
MVRLCGLLPHREASAKVSDLRGGGSAGSGVSLNSRDCRETLSTLVAPQVEEAVRSWCRTYKESICRHLPSSALELGKKEPFVTRS